VNLPSAPDSPPDPTIISRAPIEIEIGDDDKSDSLEAAYEEIGYLSDELAQTRAELQSLREKKTVDQVRAELIKPYTNKVFWFVVFYCVAVGCLLVADGIETNNFSLKESTIGIIAGSTAVSVIGLIGMVITGLFGINRSE
jgi:hypothetical protein